MQTQNVPTEELQNIVGEEHVRQAFADDAVDGVEPSLVVEPGTIEETSEVMKLVSREGLAVSPRGGGTKMGLGNPPGQVDLILSTARMDQLLEHVPGDQIVRTQAGLKLQDLQEKLAESDQMLGMDPPEEGATIGGIVAANASGPRRLRYGTVRDLIIGIKVVLADGTVAKAGGKVVKNVAGYDLSKLFTGSLGTLGIIAEANFRLHPVRESARTVFLEVEDPTQIPSVAQALTHSSFSQFVLDALEMHWENDRGVIAALFEGIEPAVEAQSSAATEALRSHGETSVLGRDDGDEFWKSFARRPWATGDVALKIGAPPSDLAAVLDSVVGAAARAGVEVRISGHAGTGVTFAGLSGEDDGLVEVVEEVREIRLRRGGSVVVQAAPLAVKERLEVWGSGGDYLGLTRRVKEKFDPGYNMNPGRFLGGI
ncbi:MAG TPA: FAD-binding oxidoreductase [Rubrobacter sp.]